MNYLVIAATTQEISPFLQQLKTWDNPAVTIDVLITGVGLTATTYALTHQLTLKKPDCILQAGIGGGFDHQLNRGTVCVIGADLIADQGVLEKEGWKSTIDMGFTEGNKSPYTDGWLNNPHTDALNTQQLPVLRAISVNQVTTEPRQIGLWAEKYRPSIESMEGAALHYVAISEQIPFLQLRAISNYVGERDKTNWDIKNAVVNLNKELLLLLPHS